MTNLSVRSAGTIDFFPAVSPGKKSAAVETKTFADQLSSTFAEGRSKFVVNHNNMLSQTPVARQNSAAASPPSVTAALGLNALVPKASAAAVTPPPPTAPATTDPVLSADDGYWAPNQPRFAAP
jgi:hypothetical protein